METQATQPRAGRSRLLIAIVVFILAAAAFAAAFVAFDGMSLVSTYVDKAAALVGLGTPPVSAPEPSAGSSTSASGLVLPQGMPETFALGLWQEQLDSQANIERLVSGEISAMKVLGVSTSGDQARVAVRVGFADSSSTDGELGLRKFGEDWYLATVSSSRTTTVTPVAPAAIDDVNPELLSEMIAQQGSSQDLIRALVAGEIVNVRVTQVATGPNTATLSLKIDGTSGTSDGKLVIVSDETSGVKRWFVTRFAPVDAK